MKRIPHFSVFHTKPKKNVEIVESHLEPKKKINTVDSFILTCKIIAERQSFKTKDENI